MLSYDVLRLLTQSLTIDRKSQFFIAYAMNLIWSYKFKIERSELYCLLPITMTSKPSTSLTHIFVKKLYNINWTVSLLKLSFNSLLAFDAKISLSFDDVKERKKILSKSKTTTTTCFFRNLFSSSSFFFSSSLQ
jgi:hypothetical protein